MLANFLIAATLSLLAVLMLLLRPLLRGQGSSASASHAAANVAVYRDQLAELERDHRAGNLSDNDFTQASTELQQRLVSEVPAQGEAAPLHGLAPAQGLGDQLVLGAVQLGGCDRLSLQLGDLAICATKRAVEVVHEYAPF